MKFSIQKFLLVIFLISSVPHLLAQNKLKKAYIVNLNNDTIYGYVKDNSNYQAYRECKFKKHKNDTIQEFGPDELVAYRIIKGKYYISREITLGENTKEVFLEYLFNGIVNIYFYKDLNGGHYFIDDESGKLHRLEYDEVEIIVNGKTYIKESNLYKGKLKAYFSESQNVIDQVDDISLTHQSLINISREYHNEICQNDDCIIYEMDQIEYKSNFTFGIIAGFNFYSFKQVSNLDESLSYLSAMESIKTNSPKLGLFIKISLPTILKNLQLQFESTYSKMSVDQTSVFTDPVYGMKNINSLSLTQNYISNNILFKYEMQKWKVNPFFELGGFLRSSVHTDFKRNLDVYYAWGDPFYSQEYDESPFSENVYGFNLGIGISTNVFKNNKIFLNLRYEKGFGFLNELHVNTISSNLGFQF